jgi:hypothetical protein
VSFRRAREPRHARLVAQDAAAGALARRVDHEHERAPPEPDQVHAEALQQTALADPRRPRHTDAQAARVPARQRQAAPICRADTAC